MPEELCKRWHLNNKTERSQKCGPLITGLTNDIAPTLRITIKNNMSRGGGHTERDMGDNGSVHVYVDGGGGGGKLLLNHVSCVPQEYRLFSPFPVSQTPTTRPCHGYLEDRIHAQFSIAIYYFSSAFLSYNLLTVCPSERLRDVIMEFPVRSATLKKALMHFHKVEPKKPGCNAQKALRKREKRMECQWKSAKLTEKPLFQ